jgi:hypothetical protein
MKFGDKFFVSNFTEVAEVLYERKPGLMPFYHWALQVRMEGKFVDPPGKKEDFLENLKALFEAIKNNEQHAQFFMSLCEDR